MNKFTLRNDQHSGHIYFMYHQHNHHHIRRIEHICGGKTYPAKGNTALDAVHNSRGPSIGGLPSQSFSLAAILCFAAMVFPTLDFVSSKCDLSMNGANLGMAQQASV